MTFDWTISLGQVVTAIFATLSLIGTVVVGWMKLSSRLTTIETWMKHAPRKDDFVEVTTKVGMMYDYFQGQMERRNRGA